MTTTAEKPIRILIADDHIVVRLGLKLIVNSEADMQVVAEAASGRELIDLYGAHRPDVVLMDLRMPGLSGDQIIATLCAENPGARVIVLTIHKGDEAVYQALRAGARGYLLKDVPTTEIVAAIRAVHAGQTCIPPALVERLAQRIGKADLTPREVEVLKLLAEGLSNKEVGSHLGVTEATATKHVAGILLKLGARDRTHAVRLGLEQGIIDLET